MTGRHSPTIRKAFATNGSISVPEPSQSCAYRAYPLSEECMATSTPCSVTRFQNGSNSGSANEREPRKPGTGAEKAVAVDEPGMIATSFPGFRELMAGLGAEIG